jgi:hypothetical protein
VDGFELGRRFEVLVPQGRRLQGVRFRWRTDPNPARSYARLGAVRLTRPGDALGYAVYWREELGDRALELGFHWLCWHDHLDRRAFVARLVARSVVDPSAAALLELVGGVVAAACESDGEVAGEDVLVLRVTAADLRDEEALIARLVTAMALRARALGVAAPTYHPRSTEVAAG